MALSRMPTVTNKADLTAYWTAIVSPDTLYDEVAVRLAFTDVTTHNLVGMVDQLDAPTALLPLMQERGTGLVRFMGTPFLERNRGFAAAGAETALIQLYRQAQQRYSCQLDDIAPTDPVTRTDLVTSDEAAYVYQLAQFGITSLAEYTARASKRLADRFATALAYVDTSVVIESVTLPEAVAALARVSFERFGADSWLAQPTIYEATLALPSLPTTHSLTVVPRLLMTPAGTCVGGHIGVVHRDTYYSLFSAASYSPALPEIGTLIHLTGFSCALASGAAILDTGLGDCGWKSRWGLQPVPQYTFTK